MRKSLMIVVVLAALSALVIVVSRDEHPGIVRARISVADALKGDTTGFARATRPASIQLPEDHGGHPQYKTEWWYYTGNLTTESGRELGYQFTIFRTALTAPGRVSTNRSSKWRATQLYTAHMAVSDPAEGRFLFADRSSREAMRMAGSDAAPFRVWVETWEIRQTGARPMDALVVADAANFALSLELRPARGPVLHGDRGLSPKSREGVDASYYYSYPRLATTGTIQIETERFEVTGVTWMDHEWSTSTLSETQVGWDWFALRLSSGHDLMYFQVRDRDPAEAPFAEATLVSPAGEAARLPAGEVRLTVTDTWTSRRTGGTYPSGWIMEIPRQAIRVEITPLMTDQELRLAVQYWEGAVSVDGMVGGLPATGRGYVELTGYTDAAFGQP